MTDTTIAELTEVTAELEHLRARVAELTRRIEALEHPSAPAEPARETPVEQPATITEEELLAISAALAAYLGVRPHIRQIRLLGTTVWAQQGRVFIQASHSL